jgi:beta-mannosidase
VCVALYRDQALRVFEARAELLLAPHGTHTTDVETLLGHFVDASYSYRFGPPGHDAVVVSLESEGALLSQSFRFPVGRPLTPYSAERLGLEARVEGDAVHLTSARVVFGVHVDAPGFHPSDDLFCLEPGRGRVVRLRAVTGGALPRSVSISAINLDSVLVAVPA